LNEMKTVKRLKIQDWGTILQVSNTPISEQDLRCTVEPIQHIMLPVCILQNRLRSRILGKRSWKWWRNSER
jgi:hypothetical protein